ncbi:hypothetical protein ACN9OJ_11520, partial [Glaesserella parasuis]|uniref:hypothetical protein n=1 Tax=Glaesserella parasuis TaxID=738 RepID=UPI003B678730
MFEGYGDLTGPPEPGLRQRLQMRLTEEGLQPLADELLSRAPAKAATVDLKNPLRVLRALEKLESTSEIIPTILPNFDKVKFG